ncbi:MAG: ABC transporter permease [Candidatus Njordarchaeia archaeon]
MLGVTTTEIVFGYLLAFTMITTIQSLLIAATTLVFSTEILNHFLFTYFLVLLLAMGSVSLSIFLSSYMKTELQVVQMIPIYIVPQIFLSGLITPLESFPEILLLVAYMLTLNMLCGSCKRDNFYECNNP